MFSVLFNGAFLRFSFSSEFKIWGLGFRKLSYHKMDKYIYIYIIKSNYHG